MEVIETVLTKFNLSNYFMARVSGTELANSKPHPEIFVQSAKLANSAPRECLVIEDSQNGITSAKAAGMKCIGFANPNSGAQNLSKADWVVHSFDELNAEKIRAF
jgi:beta-phosphoglucomutase-like phosphatase (HAD superfamily)